MKMIMIIDIPDKYKDNYKTVYNGSKKADEILNAIKNGTVLSKDATNGDMINALFPDGTQVKGASIYVMNDNKSNIFYNFDWWNASYKTDKEE